MRWGPGVLELPAGARNGIYFFIVEKLRKRRVRMVKASDILYGTK